MWRFAYFKVKTVYSLPADAFQPSSPEALLDDFRKLLHRAQEAELRGDLAEAMACLRLASALCREAGLEAKAQKMLRHLSRLEARVPPPPACGIENAAFAPRPPLLCSLCTEEVSGGFQGKSGRWLCKTCLGKATSASKHSPLCALCAGEVSGGWRGESGAWLCPTCLKEAAAALGSGRGLC